MNQFNKRVRTNTGNIFNINYMDEDDNPGPPGPPGPTPTIEIANNLTTNDPTVALSAAQGVVLKAITDGMEQDLADVGSLALNNQSNITTLQGQMTTANNNVSTLQGQMTTANTNIGTLQGQMTTANTNIATHTSQISDLQTGKQNTLTSGRNMDATLFSSNTIGLANSVNIDTITAALSLFLPSNNTTTVPALGSTRFNSTTKNLEFSDGTAWNTVTNRLTIDRTLTGTMSQSFRLYKTAGTFNDFVMRPNYLTGAIELYNTISDDPTTSWPFVFQGRISGGSYINVLSVDTNVNIHPNQELRVGYIKGTPNQLSLRDASTGNTKLRIISDELQVTDLVVGNNTKSVLGGLRYNSLNFKLEYYGETGWVALQSQDIPTVPKSYCLQLQLVRTYQSSGFVLLQPGTIYASTGISWTFSLNSFTINFPASQTGKMQVICTQVYLSQNELSYPIYWDVGVSSTSALLSPVINGVYQNFESILPNRDGDTSLRLNLLIQEVVN